MLLSDLLEKIEYTSCNRADTDLSVSSVSRDSRQVTEGTLFVCIKGTAIDGHEFAPSAYSKGARVFLAEKELSLPDDATVVIVPDTRIALAEASREVYGHPDRELSIVGITGTKGKLVFENDKLYFTELELNEREHCFATNIAFNAPPEKPVVEIEIEGDNPQHAGVCNNFIDAILGRDELFAPVEDGINGVILANSMLLSTWLGKTVDLPFDDELFYEELKKRIAISKPHPVKDKIAKYGA